MPGMLAYKDAQDMLGKGNINTSRKLSKEQASWIMFSTLKPGNQASKL